MISITLSRKGPLLVHRIFELDLKHLQLTNSMNSTCALAEYLWCGFTKKWTPNLICESFRCQTRKRCQNRSSASQTLTPVNDLTVSRSSKSCRRCGKIFTELSLFIHLFLNTVCKNSEGVNSPRLRLAMIIRL